MTARAFPLLFGLALAAAMSLPPARAVRAENPPKTDTCAACKGRQVTACPACREGKVQADCPACEKGRLTCPGCEGKSKITCKTCQGAGEVAIPSGSFGTCRTCHGSKILDCPSCKGGVAPCAECKAKGILPTPCSLCGATGRTLCLKCQDWLALGALAGDAPPDADQAALVKDLREVQAQTLQQFAGRVGKLFPAPGGFSRAVRVTLEARRKMCLAMVVVIPRETVRTASPSEAAAPDALQLQLQTLRGDNVPVRTEITADTRRILSAWHDTTWGAGIDALRVIWAVPLRDASGATRLTLLASLHFTPKRLASLDGGRVETVDPVAVADARIVAPFLDSLPDIPIPAETPK